MSNCGVMAIFIALVVGAAFAGPALAAGSDVAHYPRLETSSNAAVEQHYGFGVPAPRVRAFTDAPWADDTRRGSF